ncbi:hypothetical protein Tsp_13907 [Trichinella spiralis]|uniref:hypothetical protein n=1 Tax=Trichinella spiralis TaxID=6334 RepID=UPI0001EFDCA8|nr:hypothetical protein Tsp_13907 [Trichinella spiralis]
MHPTEFDSSFLPTLDAEGPASSQIQQSQQSMGENCAHVNNSQPTTTVANGNLDNAQRSPATSVGADLRRSLNQMFHFGTKSKANRAASDHQLAINRVDMDSAVVPLESGDKSFFFCVQHADKEE